MYELERCDLEIASAGGLGDRHYARGASQKGALRRGRLHLENVHLYLNMELEQRHYIYIMTNKRNTVLYAGKTYDLEKRVREHKNKVVKGFTKRYNINKLVYYEEFATAEEATHREKQIKAGSRKKKIELIESINPEWKDLSEGFD